MLDNEQFVGVLFALKKADIYLSLYIKAFLSVKRALNFVILSYKY